MIDSSMLVWFIGAVAIVLAAVWIVVAVLRWISPFAKRPQLRPHYLRLARIAPTATCPCRANRSAHRTYETCCRPRDMDRLSNDIRDYLWRRWSNRTFAGRRASQPMADRLDANPLPPVVLPPWVIDPASHTFPVDEAAARSWSPVRAIDASGPLD